MAAHEVLTHQNVWLCNISAPCSEPKLPSFSFIICTPVHGGGVKVVMVVHAVTGAQGTNLEEISDPVAPLAAWFGDHPAP